MPTATFDEKLAEAITQFWQAEETAERAKVELQSAKHHFVAPITDSEQRAALRVS